MSSTSNKEFLQLSSEPHEIYYSRLYLVPSLSKYCKIHRTSLHFKSHLLDEELVCSVTLHSFSRMIKSLDYGIRIVYRRVCCNLTDWRPIEAGPIPWWGLSQVIITIKCYTGLCEMTERDVLCRAGVDACWDGCHRNAAWAATSAVSCWCYDVFSSACDT